VLHLVNGSGSLEMELGLVWIQIQTLFSFIFNPSQMELVWKLQILPYNHANLNSYSGRPRWISIPWNLSDFSKQVWSPNKLAQIQKQFCFQEFYFKFSFRFELASKRKFVPYLPLYRIEKCGKFWSIIKMVFIIYKFSSVQ
jgi:hypothetical protein